MGQALWLHKLQVRRDSYVLNADLKIIWYRCIFSSGAVLRRKLPDTLLLTIGKKLLLVVVVITVSLGVIVLLIPAAEAVFFALRADKTDFAHELDEVGGVGRRTGDGKHVLIGRRNRHNRTALGCSDVALVLHKGKDFGELFPLRFLRPVLGNLERRQGVALTASGLPIAVLCGEFFLLLLFVQDDSVINADNIH